MEGAPLFKTRCALISTETRRQLRRPQVGSATLNGVFFAARVSSYSSPTIWPSSLCANPRWPCASQRSGFPQLHGCEFWRGTDTPRAFRPALFDSGQTGLLSVGGTPCASARIPYCPKKSVGNWSG